MKVQFALTLYIEKEVNGDTFENVLNQAYGFGYGSLVKPLPCTTVNDFNLDVVGVQDEEPLIRVGL